MSLSPAESAELDQARTATRDEVWAYVETARSMTADVGAQQSTSNLYLLMEKHGTTRGLGETELRVLLAEAVHMLAEAGARAPWAVSGD